MLTWLDLPALSWETSPESQVRRSAFFPTQLFVIYSWRVNDCLVRSVFGQCDAVIAAELSNALRIVAVVSMSFERRVSIGKRRSKLLKFSPTKRKGQLRLFVNRRID